MWLSRLKIGINFFKYYTDLPLANVGFFLGFRHSLGICNLASKAGRKAVFY
jgi:hypothetical protein